MIIIDSPIGEIIDEKLDGDRIGGKLGLCLKEISDPGHRLEQIVLKDFLPEQSSMLCNFWEELVMFK
jgi:hypothetical protein